MATPEIKVFKKTEKKSVSCKFVLFLKRIFKETFAITLL